MSSHGPFLQYMIHLLFFGVSGLLMTFKQAEMEKNLRNGFSLSEMDPTVGYSAMAITFNSEAILRLFLHTYT